MKKEFLLKEDKLNKTEQKFDEICKERLYEFETLKTRNHDDLDFHDIPVWALRELMQRAYDLGKEDALKEKRNEDTK